MYSIIPFIRWALTHAKAQTIPSGAALPLPIDQCGTEPWQYLFGSVRVKTTQDTLDRYYAQHYCQQMTRAEYDRITKDWDRNGYATDCEGLCDAYLTYECGERTDINANMNYGYWCTDKGEINAIDRPYVIGEALFMQSSSNGKKTHIGWVCGFDKDGNALVVEARGIAYGVVVTRLDGRPWTHRGLMTKKFSYDEEPKMKTIFEYTSPMKTGEPFLYMQMALNKAGYTDNDGRELEEDGKWGRRSQQAFDSLIAAHSPVNESPVTPPVVVVPAEPEKPDFVITSTDGAKELRLFIKDKEA